MLSSLLDLGMCILKAHDLQFFTPRESHWPLNDVYLSLSPEDTKEWTGGRGLCGCSTAQARRGRVLERRETDAVCSPPLGLDLWKLLWDRPLALHWPEDCSWVLLLLLQPAQFWSWGSPLPQHMAHFPIPLSTLCLCRAAWDTLR